MVRRACCLLFGLLAAAAPAAPAWAVIPGMAGPLQTLMAMLSQLLPFLAAGLAGVAGVPAWRRRALALLQRARSRPRLAWGTLGLVILLGTVLLVWQGRAPRRVVAMPAPTVRAEWPMFRGNLRRTGALGRGTSIASLRPRWVFQDANAPTTEYLASPAPAGSRVYAAAAFTSVFDSTGMLYCLDAATGRRIWQFPLARQPFSSPAVAGGRAFVGEGLHTDEDCHLYCLEATTGALRWKVRTAGHVESTPAIHQDRVYFGAGEDGVYCVEADGGRVLWRRPGLHCDLSPAVADGRVFVGSGYGNHRAAALDAATGRVLWETPFPVPVWGSPAVEGERVWFAGGRGNFAESDARPLGAVFCLDAATGRVVWRRELPDAVLTAVALAEGRLYVGCRDGHLYALDAATGRTVWKRATGGPVVASPVVADSVIAVAAGGRLHLFDRQGASRFTLDLAPWNGSGQAVYSSPALTADRLLLGTMGGRMLCLGPP